MPSSKPQLLFHFRFLSSPMHTPFYHPQTHNLLSFASSSPVSFLFLHPILLSISITLSTLHPHPFLLHFLQTLISIPFQTPIFTVSLSQPHLRPPSFLPLLPTMSLPPRHEHGAHAWQQLKLDSCTSPPTRPGKEARYTRTQNAVILELEGEGEIFYALFRFSLFFSAKRLTLKQNCPGRMCHFPNACFEVPL